jgi:NitT/TauT family transport system ATP-binding protein
LVTKDAVLEMKGVSKWFPGANRQERVSALEGLDLVIPNEEAGEFVALLGPSGCGKSTVLSLIAGLQEPSEGEVLTFGARAKCPNPDTVTVQQAYTCFPWLTALGNVEFGLRVQGKRDNVREVATEYLEKVGLGDRLNAYPKEMSGGMQQRIAIARALAVKPKMVLMDEPFGALDAQTRSDMQQMLLGLWEAERNSILFVTHDITEAVLLASRVIVFSPRPAKVIYDMPVPFPRPRRPELTSEPSFITVTQSLLNILKQGPTQGQVRVTI